MATGSFLIHSYISTYLAILYEHTCFLRVRHFRLRAILCGISHVETSVFTEGHHVQTNKLPGRAATVSIFRRIFDVILQKVL
jgi:hypothetical protein